jgi:hypothetical protein
MQSSDINQAVQKLISENRFEEGELTIGEPMKVENIFSTFEHLFNDKAKAALNNKTVHLVHQRNEELPSNGLMRLLGALGVPKAQEYIDNGGMYIRVADLVQFFASRASSIENIPKAIEKVVKNLNELADKDFVTASLLPLSILRITNVEQNRFEYIVISYAAITSAGSNYIDLNMKSVVVKEGELPPYTEDQ